MARRGVDVGISIRSCLTAGVAIITAAAIAFVPSVEEPAPAAAPAHVVQIASPPIKLTAQVQPSVTSTNLPDLLVEWLQRIVVPPSAGQPFPTPQFPPVVAPTSIGSSIKGVYNAVEPWVRWGFDVAAYAVGWIPYVGWLAPQITIFYNFGERIARSITFNIADWLDRHISFGQGLVNVGVDTINSFIFLANDQLAFWLPPLPPIPPIGPFAAASATTEATSLAATTATTNALTATAPLTAKTATTTEASADLLAPAARAVDTDEVAADTLLAGAIDVASVPASIESALKTAATPTEAPTPQADVTEQSASDTTSAEVANNTEDQQSDGAQEARASASSPRAVRAQVERRRGTDTSDTEKVTDKKATEPSSTSATEKPAKADEGKRTARASTRHDTVAKAPKADSAKGDTGKGDSGKGDSGKE